MAMIYFSNEANESMDSLFYFPFTTGRHLQKTIADIKKITNSLSLLPQKSLYKNTNVNIAQIGKVRYITTPKALFIQSIIWSNYLTQFYYKKSNFIEFTDKKNIPSVHPSFYKERIGMESNEDENSGIVVVSRKRGTKELFNFKNSDGEIICDVDFIQVHPFSKDKDNTARGYTPDRRCYMIFTDGSMEEVNESLNRNKLYLKENDIKVDISIGKILHQLLIEHLNKSILMR